MALPIANWIRKRKWYFIVGVPLLWFALAPFSLFGCGMIYPIVDTLRGHPEGAHGSHPPKFAGLWIRDESIEFDFVGQAFYLLPDGRFAGMTGMTERRWHFDDGRLFIDSVSRCGNCYQGNLTAEHTVRFEGADVLFVTNARKAATRGIMGRYRRFKVDEDLKSRLTHLAKATDEPKSFRGRMALTAIERFELYSRAAP